MHASLKLPLKLMKCVIPENTPPIEGFSGFDPFSPLNSSLGSYFTLQMWSLRFPSPPDFPMILQGRVWIVSGTAQYMPVLILELKDAVL